MQLLRIKKQTRNSVCFLIIIYYSPHLSCAPQLVHVLQPPSSATSPFLQTGHVSPISEPIVTLVFPNSEIVSIRITLDSGESSTSSISSLKLFCSAFKVRTCESRLPSTYTVPPFAPPRSE